MIENPDTEFHLALRALRDCGVIRAPWWHPGYRLLRNRHLVSYVPVPWTDLFDFRLTDHGLAYARAALKPWPPNRL